MKLITVAEPGGGSPGDTPPRFNFFHFHAGFGK